MNEDDLKARMAGVLEVVRTDVASVRTGRATPSLVQDIVVTTYGGAQKLRVVELGTVTAPDTRTLVISPWDKSTVFDIKRALEEANIGANPTVDNDAVRINFPPMTSEDRQAYIKILGAKLENGKIMVRRVRQEAMEETRRAFDEKEFGEDEKYRREERIQKLTDEYVAKIEEIGEKKEAELMQV